MQSLKLASALITLFRKNQPLISDTPWVEWRESLENILEGEVQVGTIHAEVNTGKRLATSKNHTEAITSELQNLNEEELKKCKDFIYLYRSFYELEGDEEYNGALLHDLNEMITGFSTVLTLESSIPAHISQWTENQREDKFKEFLVVPATTSLLYWDFALRCVILAFFLVYSPTDSSVAATSFWLGQILIVPMIIFLIGYYRNRVIVKKSGIILEKLSNKNLLLKTKISAWQYLFIAVIAITGVVITGHFDNPEKEFHNLTPYITGGFILIYLLLIQTNLAKSHLTYADAKKQLLEKEHTELKEDLSAEENDEEIVNLEVNLKAENERMDAYVIEAALFGALAFSGFLQIVSSDNFNIDFVNTFNNQIGDWLYSIFDSDNKLTSPPIFQILISKSSLMVLMSYLALFCSIFFLAVIASRLRFSTLTDYVDRALQLSKAYNQKEEGLLLQGNKEHGKYTQLIVKSLKEGYKMQAKIRPIMEYMQFFRTLGIATFFVIIVLGGLFLSGALSIILALIALLSFGYFKLNNIRKSLKHAYVKLQEFYFPKRRYANYTGWGLFLLGVLFRTFGWSEEVFVSVTIVTGVLILLLNSILDLFIPENLDFNTIVGQSWDKQQQKRAKLQRALLKLAMILLYMFFASRQLHIPGANINLLLSFILFIIYFSSIPKFVNSNESKSKKGVINLTSSIAIIMLLLSILWQSMNWPGKGSLYLLGLSFSIPLVYLIYSYKASLRKTVSQAVFILSIIHTPMFSDHFKYGVSHFSFNPTETKTGVFGDRLVLMVETNEFPPLEELKYSFEVIKLLSKNRSPEKWAKLITHDLGHVPVNGYRQFERSKLSPAKELIAKEVLNIWMPIVENNVSNEEYNFLPPVFLLYHLFEDEKLEKHLENTFSKYPEILNFNDDFTLTYFIPIASKYGFPKTNESELLLDSAETSTPIVDTLPTPQVQ